MISPILCFRLKWISSLLIAQTLYTYLVDSRNYNMNEMIGLWSRPQWMDLDQSEASGPDSYLFMHDVLHSVEYVLIPSRLLAL